VLLADPITTESPEKFEPFIEAPFTVILSLDDDEENIGFDELEDLDNDELDDDDDDDFEDEEEEEEDDDEVFGDEEDDDLDDEGFDDDDDDF